MALSDINPLLNLTLIIIEFVILTGFLTIYIRNRNVVLKPLIWSITLFLFSNILSFVFYGYLFSYLGGLVVIILAHVLIGGALILLIIYLEMFDRDEPYTKRSTIAVILIMLTGILQMVGNFVDELRFLGLLTPIPYMITGILYLRYVKRLKESASVHTQKRKIGRVRSGIFMIFASPLLIYLTLIIFGGIFIIVSPEAQDTLLSQTPDSFNLGSIDPIVMFSQLIGVIFLSAPILFSGSTYFMQSKQIMRLIVINDTGLPIYDFSFEQKNRSDEMLLSGALTAIKTVMKEATGASKELKSIVFGDLHIITEVRDGFAVNLLVGSSTAYLKDALRLFTDDFQLMYRQDTDTSIIDPEMMKEANKLIQKNFGLEREELEEMLALQDSIFAPTPTIP